MTTVYMTSEKLIVADLLIKRLQIGHPNTISGGLWYSLLNDKYDELGDDKFNKANQVLQGGNYGEIINFLVEQDYIEVVNYAIPNYKLTAKGKEARNKGGHNAYVEWQKEQAALAAAEAEQNRKEQKKLNWPQKYWWLIAIFTYIGTKACDKGFEYYNSKQTTEEIVPVQKSTTPSIKRPDTPVVRTPDTVAAKI
jgi:hypothetical protein